MEAGFDDEDLSSSSSVSTFLHKGDLMGPSPPHTLPPPSIGARSTIRHNSSPRFTKANSERQSQAVSTEEPQDRREVVEKHLASMDSQFFSAVCDEVFMRDLVRLQTRIKSAKTGPAPLKDLLSDDSSAPVAASASPPTNSVSHSTTFHHCDRFASPQSRQDRIISLVQEQKAASRLQLLGENNDSISTELAVDYLILAAKEMKDSIEKQKRRLARRNDNKVLQNLPNGDKPMQPQGPRLRSAERAYRRVLQVVGNKCAMSDIRTNRPSVASSEDEAFVNKIIESDMLRKYDEAQPNIALGVLQHHELEELRQRHSQAASQGAPLYVKSRDDLCSSVSSCVIDGCSPCPSYPDSVPLKKFEFVETKPIFSNLPTWLLEPVADEPSCEVQKFLKKRREKREQLAKRQKQVEKHDGRPPSRQVGRYNELVRCPVINLRPSKSVRDKSVPTDYTKEPSKEPSLSNDLPLSEKVRHAVQQYKMAYDQLMNFKASRSPSDSPSPGRSTNCSSLVENRKSPKIVKNQNRVLLSATPPKSLKNDRPRPQQTKLTSPSVNPSPLQVRTKANVGSQEQNKPSGSISSFKTPKPPQKNISTARVCESITELTPSNVDANCDSDRHPVSTFVHSVIDEALASSSQSAIDSSPIKSEGVMGEHAHSLSADLNSGELYQVTSGYQLSTPEATAPFIACDSLTEMTKDQQQPYSTAESTPGTGGNENILLSVGYLRTETQTPHRMSATNGPNTGSPFIPALSTSSSPAHEGLSALTRSYDRQMSIATQQFGDSGNLPTPPPSPLVKAELPILPELTAKPRGISIPSGLTLGHTLLLQRVGRGYLGSRTTSQNLMAQSLSCSGTSNVLLDDGAPITCIVTIIEAVNALLPLLAGLQSSIVGAYGRDPGMSTSFGIGTFALSTTSAIAKGKAMTSPMASETMSPKGPAPIYATANGSQAPPKLYGKEMDATTRKALFAFLPELDKEEMSRANVASPKILSHESRSMSPIGMLTSYTNFDATIGGGSSLAGGATMPPFTSPLSPRRTGGLNDADSPYSSPNCSIRFRGAEGGHKYKPDATVSEALQLVPSSSFGQIQRLHNDDLLSTQASVDFGLSGGSSSNNSDKAKMVHALYAAQLVRMYRLRLDEIKFLPTNCVETIEFKTPLCLEAIVESFLCAALKIAKAVNAKYSHYSHVRQQLRVITFLMPDGFETFATQVEFIDPKHTSTAATSLLRSCGRRSLSVLKAALSLTALVNASQAYKARNRLRLRAWALAEAERQMRQWDIMDKKAIHIQRVVRGWLGRRRARRIKRDREMWATYGQ